MQADLYRAAESASRSVESFTPGGVIGVEGSAMDRLLIVREGSCCRIEVRMGVAITCVLVAAGNMLSGNAVLADLRAYGQRSDAP